MRVILTIVERTSNGWILGAQTGSLRNFGMISLAPSHRKATPGHSRWPLCIQLCISCIAGSVSWLILAGCACLGRSAWPVKALPPFCHLSSFKRVEYFSLRPRLAQSTSSLKFSARLGCFSCIIPPLTLTPPPQLAFGRISGILHMLVGMYLFLPGAVDAKIYFLLGEIYKYIFLLDRKKEPQIFP